jgi:hypothetical protein
MCSVADVTIMIRPPQATCSRSSVPNQRGNTSLTNQRYPQS